MKAKVWNWVDIVAASINYVLVNYALSNLAMLLRSNPLFILFFASEVWMMQAYWKRVEALTQRRTLATALLIACFAAHIALVYFVGRVVGEIVPFRP